MADMLPSAGVLLDGTGEFGRMQVVELMARATAQRGWLSEALDSSANGLSRAARLVDMLGQERLQRLALGLNPGLGRRDLEVTETLWAKIPGGLLADGLKEPTRWQFNLLAADGALPRWGGIAGLVDIALGWLAERGGDSDQLARAIYQAVASTRSPAATQIAAALKDRVALLTPARVITEDPDRKVRGSAMTQSAGLILFNPYLPTLFARRELTEAGAFRSEDAIAQAFDLLHHILAGNAAYDGAPRPLERTICGVPPEVSIRPPLRLDADAAALVDGLLQSVISQWKVLGNTSIEGLRESFLRREGVLEWHEEQTLLRVSPKSFDMLLDSIPWTINLLKFPWMDKPLHVNWRGSDD